MSKANQGHRRDLRFSSIEEALAEAERLVAAEREGRLTRTGTFELGQTLGHLATWASYPFDGYPPEVRPPLPVRMIIRLMRNRFLSKSMPPGIRVRGIPNGTLGLEILPADQGMQNFRTAFGRLREKCPPGPNPIFGPMTHEQWIQLNLRHAELHFSFLSFT